MGVHRPEVSARKWGGARGFSVGASAPSPDRQQLGLGLHSASFSPRGSGGRWGTRAPHWVPVPGAALPHIPDPSTPSDVSPSSSVVHLPGGHHKAPASTPTKGPVFRPHPQLLEAALLPNKAAILHCRGHQKRSLISAYNNAADQKTKEIALSHPFLQHPVILALTPSDPPTTKKILSYLHSLFHPSSKTLQQFLHNYFPIFIADQQYLDNLTCSCETCQRIKPNSNLKPTSFPTHQMRDSLPAGR